MHNILIFPGGTENGLEIYRSLQYAKNVNLYSVSSDVPNHAKFVYQNHFIIPDIYNEDCLTRLNEIIDQNDIKLIFPANSLVIDFLVENRDNINAKIFLTDNDIVRTVRSKKKTYLLFKEIIPTPKILNVSSIDEYPVFIKPDKLYGSQGARIIYSPNVLNSIELDLSDYVITEYLQGKEFTVDCLSTKKN